MTHGWKHLISDWTIVDAGRRRDFRVQQRLYSGPEMEALMLRAGFSKVTLFGALDGSAPYDHNAKRLVVCASA